MKQRQTWLFALLSILTFIMVPCLATAASSGQLELGASYTDIVDNAARVNEYVKNGASDNLKEDGLAASIKLDLEATDGTSAADLSADIINGDNFSLETEVDAARIFKLDISLDSMQHIKDHETLGQLGATLAGDVGGEQPRLTTDATVGQLGVDSVTVANERYAQEMDNDYIVTRKELETETELTLPALPNITFHAGLRIETRDGLEQARTLSKCNQCHVQANAKDIDERTEDFTIGVTGKFGLVTVEYEFLTRDFTADGASPEYNYLGSGSSHAGIPDSSVLNYTGVEDYSKTPDSEKDSHLLKARVDVNSNTSLSATYVNAEVESNTVEDSSYTINTNSLTSEFESFFLKGATRLGGLRLSVRGGTYQIDGPEYTVDYAAVATNIDPALGYDGTKDYESAESRDVTEFGIDGVYRLATGTTLRLGYEYEEVDRDEAELADTETNTFKASIKSRFSKQLSARLSYKYQNIDDPFSGAAVGIFQETGMTSTDYPGMAYVDKSTVSGDPGNGPGVYYWNSVYPNRELESSMSPESVHEAKFSSTWAPSVNMAATLFARVRMEENDAVEYKQDTYVPGISFYYAPSGKMNLTMAYTFSKQDTENRMCVGWYHG